MNKIQNRYAGAVHSGNLRSKPTTKMSDSDVLGAAGLASRGRTEMRDGVLEKHKGVELGVGLQRLFAGDDREGVQLVRLLASMAWVRAKHEGVKLKRVQADDLARTVLAWFRAGTCKACGGHGYKIASGKLGEGRAVISDARCKACRGTRKVNFDRLFSMEQLLIARWLKEQIEREQSAAGAEIMKALSDELQRTGL